MTAGLQHMSDDLAAVFSELLRERDALGLPALKPGVAEAAAVQILRMRDAAARIEDEGLLIADAKGNAVPHPALEVERLAQDALRKLVG